MRVSAFLIQYDGSGFYGFQRQTNFHSVQAKLEKAFHTVCRENSRFTPAGRTDTGVHARGMIVSVPHQNKITDYRRVVHSLNALSSDSLSVLGGKEMPEKFNARFSCTEREYEYWIYYAKAPSPLLNSRAYWMKFPLDLERVQKEIPSIVGKHNFKSFAKLESVRTKSAERQITSLSLIPSAEIPGLIRFQIRGTGFLHNMVRILVGTILSVGSGKITDSLEEILQKEDRTTAGKTLPPYGLYFQRAYYQDYLEIDSLYTDYLF